MRRKKIKTCPIYVDGPLAYNVTKVFRENWEYCDEVIQRAFMRKEDPFSGTMYVILITLMNQSG
jgi:predicted metal-dependent RNase